ncbi:MAG TPA: SPFH domain-containing protein [Candidatus Paceibacterota bacterium]|nr:SPFH domain-containing protein [Candidatus Pacearchaeota archaeon]HRZ51200.1 SPFH domain-containing protein [Candidatus Paceibacterota bacterium]HSA36922.1 SPFH domain-containing protein [Candidatus Paceibacterota bacterium]
MDNFGPMHGPVLPSEDDTPGRNAGTDQNPAEGSEHGLPRPEPEPAVETPAPTASGRSEYTEEQQTEMAAAASLEHRMNVLAGLLLVLPLALGLYYLAGGVWVNFTQALCCFAASGLLAILFIKEVQATPKQIGIRTWMGGRIPYLVQEGYCLVIPFIWDVIRIDVMDKNTDLSQVRVAVKNGTIGVLASMTWHPDYKNPFSVIRYLDVGQAAGVEDIISDPTNQGIREYAITKKMEKALKDKKGFREAIISTIVNVEDEALKSEMISSFNNGSRHLVLRLVGIEILQITVPDIGLPDYIQKARDDLAKEELEQRSEKTEREHFRDSIIELRDRIGLNPEKATETWLLFRKLIKKDVHQEQIEVSGLEGKDPLGLTTPLHLLSRGMQARQGGQPQQKGKSNKEEE